MAIELKRFYNDTRITVSFPRVPPGNIVDWQSFLLDTAKQLEPLVRQNGSSGLSFAPFVIYHEGTPEEIRVQLYFPSIPSERYADLLSFLLYGIVYVYRQPSDKIPWRLGVLAADIKTYARAIAEGPILEDMLNDFFKRYTV